ncbi:MAG: PEGA domain-containing protein [Deltaproteobacteria bacterium]|nr:PEGA domain-containing protein [Deltaproteobacteria bacterium]
MARAVVVGLVALGALLSSPEARAEKVRLAVVELWSPPNLAGISAKLTQDIVSAASRDPDTTVIEPAAVEKALGPEALKSLQSCNGNAGCVAQRGIALPADKLVVGTLDRTEASYLVKLFLVDLKAKSVVSTVDRSILIASRRLQSDVAAAIPGLLKGKAEAKGKLTVTTTSPGATVTFDGEVIGRTPMTIEAKPGTHTLKVLKDGFLPVERFVNVEDGAIDQVGLVLTAIPGTKQEEQLVQSAAEAHQTHSQAGSGVTIPAASWIAGATALAAAGVGSYFAVTAGQLESKAGEGPVYGITRQEAIAGKRNALVSNICWGVAGAAAATSVLLAIVLQGADAQPVPEAAPQASLAPLPGGAAVTLSGSF